MTSTRGDSANPNAKAAAESLQLRARPQPVTRINRKVLIGGAAVLLVLISGIVLVALKAPSLRLGERPELFNVDHKPITDGLSKLPATYDGLRPEKESRRTKIAARGTAADASINRRSPR
jgi:type IV secretion system protein VirB10